MSLNRLPDSQAWLPFSYLLSEKHDALLILQIRKLTVPGPFYSLTQVSTWPAAPVGPAFLCKSLVSPLLQSSRSSSLTVLAADHSRARCWSEVWPEDENSFNHLSGVPASLL